MGFHLVFLVADLLFTGFCALLALPMVIYKAIKSGRSRQQRGEPFLGEPLIQKWKREKEQRQELQAYDSDNATRDDPLFESDPSDCEDLSSDESEAIRLHATLMSSLTVDTSLWDDLGWSIKYTLIRDYSLLTFNFEIKGAPAGLPRDRSIIALQAIFYDTDQNPLYIEDTWIECENLSKGRYSDYICFDLDSIATATSMEVLARWDD